jgi:undecaprenyl-diphosphatase
MSLWFAAVLGLVQGLTEFIPVSSTAHLRIAPALLGQPDPGAPFSAVIQLGTLLAVVGYFARDLFVKMPRALLFDRSSFDARLAGYLVLGTIPIVIAGLSLKDFVTGDARSLYVVGSMLIAVGLLFFVAERIGSKNRPMEAITLVDAMLIGLAQTCALVPGVSRSGATIACALILGMRRSDAARFSFLLGVPAIAGAGIFELRDAVADLGPGAWLPIVIGTTTAAISGYASIAWLIRFLGKRGLASFGIYRIAVGLLILGLCIAGVLAPGSGG